MTRTKDHLILSGSSKADEYNSGGFDEGANWFEWVRQWADSSGNLKPKLVEVPNEKSGRHFTALAEHKKIKTALEQAAPVKIKMAEGVLQLIEFLKPIEPLYFERIDLPVSAYAVFKHDQEEFKRTYELGVLPEEPIMSFPHVLGGPRLYEPKGSERNPKSGSPTKTFGDDIKGEEWSEAEDEEVAALNAADFGTLVHKLFEHLVSHPQKASVRLKFWLERFQKSLNQSTFKEVKNLAEIFLKSQQFLNLKSAKKRHPEVPFVLRLHHGIIQGTLDLLYQNSSGDWIILDYKTSVIARTRQYFVAGTKQSQTEIASAMPGALPCNDNDDLKTHADRYQSQMLLYALACYELLNIKPKAASLYFVRTDQSFDFSLVDVNYGNLRREFEALQKQILDQRKKWIANLK